MLYHHPPPNTHSSASPFRQVCCQTGRLNYNISNVLAKSTVLAKTTVDENYTKFMYQVKGHYHLREKLLEFRNPSENHATKLIKIDVSHKIPTKL